MGPPGPAGPTVSCSFSVQTAAKMQAVAGLGQLLPSVLQQEQSRTTMGRLGHAMMSCLVSPLVLIYT